jgi:hypothetical protein
VQILYASLEVVADNIQTNYRLKNYRITEYTYRLQNLRFGIFGFKWGIRELVI